ncbi:ABC1 kinase family protein [Polyangium sorediatum]|uniref:AarF/ABC1/UbiB kinase family protein n=1 Tax=Polyangium sorediatum TaxID=889274 RepID=A0ABT6NXN2_9BACT|nr:AarF/ABC1/UbiB kinase family protein [Polyangium sorediatum]MDI1433116.1 AarF/ABC1/UbiB kinase family protein [Polyangium sorediatum]
MATSSDHVKNPRIEEESSAPERRLLTLPVSQPLILEAEVVEQAEVQTTISGSVRRHRRGRSDRSVRERDIQRRVASSLKDYKAQEDMLSAFNEGADAGVVRDMPRRKISGAKPGPPPEIPMAKVERFKASTWSTLVRFLSWYRVYIFYMLAVLWDRVRGKDSVESRAKRLLQSFQRIGGSLVKIGQQLAIRVDVLPYEYCRELAKLLDAMKPFPVEQAVEAIERATGKPLDETFLIFDPEPIGSASIACVYQAVLKNGQKVAVKVRRPGIGEVFARDVRAMRWLINAMELSAIVRPGYMQNFVREFEDTVMEELDFRLEAYHQALFSREAKKFKVKGKQICSAAECYLDISSTEVLIQEFVSGIWMSEIISGVEHKIPETLARMNEMHIEPRVISERLLYIQMWSQYISSIFHADPHPANILVREDNEIVFIDFGACGAMDRVKKEAALDQLHFMLQNDLSSMIQCMLAVMQPLPPIDVDKFAKDVEVKIAQNLQRLMSKRAEWYEKTTASGWFTMMSTTQKYQLPMNLDTVRAFRANMLYDTLALRVYPRLEPLNVWRKFLKQFDENAKRDAKKALQKRLTGGLLTGAESRAIDETVSVVSRAMKSARRLMDQPMLSFSYMVEKSIFTVVEVMRLAILLSATLFMGSLVAMVVRKVQGLPLDMVDIARSVATHTVFLVVAGLISLVSVRRITLRLGDLDVS